MDSLVDAHANEKCQPGKARENSGYNGPSLATAAGDWNCHWRWPVNRCSNRRSRSRSWSEALWRESLCSRPRSILRTRRRADLRKSPCRSFLRRSIDCLLWRRQSSNFGRGSHRCLNSCPHHSNYTILHVFCAYPYTHLTHANIYVGTTSPHTWSTACRPQNVSQSRRVRLG